MDLGWPGLALELSWIPLGLELYLHGGRKVGLVGCDGAGRGG